MCPSNHVRDEVTEPLIQENSYPELHFLKSYSYALSVFANETISIVQIAYPLVLTGLLLYFRSFISMYFLGSLGDENIAGGSLGLAFGNITGYSVFSGATNGVESICSQAFGAKRYKLFRATIQRGIVLLLLSSLPVSLLWINMEKILVVSKQNKDLASQAQTFLLCSVPDLISLSFLHPLRVYLRTQSKTLPLLICTAIASFLHLPITYLFVKYLRLEIKGLAFSGVVTNFNLVASLFLYITFFEENLINHDEEEEPCEDNKREWTKLAFLAFPSCVSVCLEWWCYEIMIVLCGFLVNPKETVASMGILIQITSLVYIFPSSLSYGVSTRVGNELGSNQPRRARQAAIVGLGLSIVLGFISLTFTFLVRHKWAKFFTVDAKIISLTSMALPIVGICELGNCPQTTGCGVLRGSARPKIGAFINTAAFYGVGIPVGLVMGFWFGYGLNGLWYGMLAAQILCVISMMVATCKTDWELEAARAKELTTVDGGSIEENGGHQDDGDGEVVEVGEVETRESVLE